MGTAAPPLVSRIPGWSVPVIWLLLIASLLAVGPEGHPQLRLALVPLLPIAVAAAAALAVVWSRLLAHRALRRLLPLMAILMLVPIQFLSGWDGVHDGVIVILPLSWAALQGQRRDVLWGVAGAAAVCFAGPVVDRYIPPSLIFDALTISVWSIAALVLNGVVVRARGQAHDLAIAYHDALTGLPNRRGWDELLVATLTAAEVAQSPVTMLIVDRDDFADYNDDWGHDAGDRELSLTSTAWRQSLRACDLMARIGADEFAVALPEATMADADALLARLNAATASLSSFAAGTAQWDGRETAVSLTARCSAALAEAKRRQRVDGEPRVVSAGDAQPGWLTVLPGVLHQKGIESVYQPIVRLAGRSIAGYEALARPAGANADLAVDGMFATARTLGVAAELEMLCVRCAVLGSRALPAHADLFVNIGAGALHRPDELIAVLDKLLPGVERDPGGIVLEISEAVTRIGRFAAATASLRRAGYRLALDDAGEANSAIESLAVVRPAFVKLGRSLAISHADPGSAATIHALVQFAQFAGGAVIAEGIEREEDCYHLQALGVEFGQGFALGRPRRVGTAAAPHLIRVA